MVQAYRLLVATMKAKGMNYPLHLGVTEAGDGEDGRIKSAVGIGALLEDGIGDTIRVSLTEDPEFEIPVAQKLVEKFSETEHIDLKYSSTNYIDYYSHTRRETHEIEIIGGKHVPVVVADLSGKTEITPTNLFGFGYNYSVGLDKWNLQDMAADILYTGDHSLSFEVPGTLRVVQNFATWKTHENPAILPYCTLSEYASLGSGQQAFVSVDLDMEYDAANLPLENIVLVLETKERQKTQKIRKIQCELAENKNFSPVILKFHYESSDPETAQLYEVTPVSTL
jgi:(E)-4-hydroxy-3-methylbut-2-enyl-diphosphate synthase